MADAPLRLANRLALRVSEVATALGLSEGAFREHLLPTCPKIHAGRTVLIPVEPLKKYLEARAAEDGQEIGESVDALFERVDDRGAE